MKKIPYFSRHLIVANLSLYVYLSVNLCVLRRPSDSLHPVSSCFLSCPVCPILSVSSSLSRSDCSVLYCIPRPVCPALSVCCHSILSVPSCSIFPLQSCLLSRLTVYCIYVLVTAFVFLQCSVVDSNADPTPFLKNLKNTFNPNQICIKSFCKGYV